MLSALLLAGLFAAPISTAALFLPADRPARRGEERWRWIVRMVLTLAWAAIVIAVVDGALALIGVTDRNIEAVTVGLGIATVVWLPITRRWGARAHVCWAATTYVFAVYLAFMMYWTFASHLGLTGTVGGLALWLLELVAAGLGGAYLWELCDTLGRASWVRRIGTQELGRITDGPYPYVCLQVPCYNEPPEMVIETLRSLQALDYPNYEIQVLDDNTDDEDLWRPVEAWCERHRVKFVHLSNWPGYKSGALNYALRQMVDDRCELIGVIDSDYQIAPDFLRQCAPLFADHRVGFIQAPQDYRDWEEAPFYRRLYHSYQYFFAVSQPSRNERNGAIFAGTMGLIRRAALEAVGGWDEWCITEDAELSFRLLRAGWSGLHVDRSFGKGIMPLTFEALKGQRFRWCFGGIQILRLHWRAMIPGRESRDNRLTLGQRWAYLAGGVQWYGDLLALVFYVFLLVGAANSAFGEGLVFRKLTGFLVAAIPLLVALGLLRAVALLRRGTGATWSEAIGAFLIWQSTALTVALASVQGLFARQAAFLRTPKTLGEHAWSDALKGNWAECLLGLLGLAGIVGALTRTSGGGFLLAILLLWPTVSFLAAPYNSWSAQRAALPPELSARRRTEHLRSGGRRLTFAIGGLSLSGATAAAALALFIPGPANIAPPQLMGPASGQAAHYGPSPPNASPNTLSMNRPNGSKVAKAPGGSINRSSTRSGATTSTTTTGTTTTGTTTTGTTTTGTTTTGTTTTPTTATTTPSTTTTTTPTGTTGTSTATTTTPTGTTGTTTAPTGTTTTPTQTTGGSTATSTAPTGTTTAPTGTPTQMASAGVAPSAPTAASSP